MQELILMLHDFHKETALLKTVKYGYKECMASLIKAGADVNMRNKEKRTPLTLAAQKGYSPCLQLIINEEADVNAGYAHGFTPLVKAVTNGHDQCVAHLINAAADLSKSSSRALMIAAQEGHVKCVEQLIQSGVDVNSKTKKGTTALMNATLRGNVQCVTALIEAGADVNTPNNKGETALAMCGKFQVAASSVLIECFVKLVEAGAEVRLLSANTLSAWMSSLCYNQDNPGVMRTLLQAGADVNLKDSTSLMKAADKGHENNLKVLINSGTVVNAADKEGTTPLMYVVFSPGDKLSMVQTLLDAGADVNQTKHNGVSALMRAALCGHPRNVKVLIKAAANVNLVDNKGVSALMKAAFFGHQQCVKLLIERGADVNVSNKDGMTPLMAATYMGIDKHGVLRPGSYSNDDKRLIVDWLIKAGADVNAVTNSGKNALINAILMGYDKSLELLISAGADVNNLDYNITALIIATGRNHAQETKSKTVKILLKSGAHVNKDKNVGCNVTESAKQVNSAKERREIVQFLFVAGESTVSEIGDIFKCPEFEKGLKHLCREAIRKHLLELDEHISLFQRIPKLGLPSLLAKYLLYHLSLDTAEGEVDKNTEEKVFHVRTEFSCLQIQAKRL